ncbi:hypothetical protein CYMTET_52461, partial [Cymbomonas tetramitiformis]
VNLLGEDKVVKVSWKDTLRRMKIDFRLFRHSRRILQTLDLSDTDARIVEKMLYMVGLSEDSTCLEFDLVRERKMMERASTFLGAEWQSSWIEWASKVDLAHAPLVANMQNPALLQQLLESKGPTVKVPSTFPELSGEQALVQQKAEGESLTCLLRCTDMAPAESTSPQALGVLAAVIVPLQGFMLLVLSEHHGCHTDPHPGNFRFDTATRTLWVLDWGCFIHLDRQDRRNMCR